MDSRRLDMLQDIAELDKLISQSSRQAVQTRLFKLKAELQTEFESLPAPAAKAEEETKDLSDKDTLIYRPIERFAWDQTSKEVKVYVTTLDGLKDFKDKVSLHHTSESIDVKIVDFKGQNFRLRFQKLNKPISNVRITFKSSGFGLTLKKKEEKSWDALEFKAPIVSKEEKAPVEDDPSNPGAGLMKMMQDLYQNGDEDMKRTIAQAWSQAQDGKKPEL